MFEDVQTAARGALMPSNCASGGRRLEESGKSVQSVWRTEGRVKRFLTSMHGDFVATCS